MKFHDNYIVNTSRTALQGLLAEATGLALQTKTLFLLLCSCNTQKPGKQYSFSMSHMLQCIEGLSLDTDPEYGLLMDCQTGVYSITRKQINVATCIIQTKSKLMSSD